jgi:hypothetical protein
VLCSCCWWSLATYYYPETAIHESYKTMAVSRGVLESDHELFHKTKTSKGHLSSTIPRNVCPRRRINRWIILYSCLAHTVFFPQIQPIVFFLAQYLCSPSLCKLICTILRRGTLTQAEFSIYHRPHTMYDLPKPAIPVSSIVLWSLSSMVIPIIISVFFAMTLTAPTAYSHWEAIVLPCVSLSSYLLLPLEHWYRSR